MGPLREPDVVSLGSVISTPDPEDSGHTHPAHILNVQAAHHSRPAPPTSADTPPSPADTGRAPPSPPAEHAQIVWQSHTFALQPEETPPPQLGQSSGPAEQDEQSLQSRPSPPAPSPATAAERPSDKGDRRATNANRGGAAAVPQLPTTPPPHPSWPSDRPPTSSAPTPTSPNPRSPSPAPPPSNTDVVEPNENSVAEGGILSIGTQPVRPLIPPPPQGEPSDFQLGSTASSTPLPSSLATDPDTQNELADGQWQHRLLGGATANWYQQADLLEMLSTPPLQSEQSDDALPPPYESVLEQREYCTKKAETLRPALQTTDDEDSYSSSSDGEPRIIHAKTLVRFRRFDDGWPESGSESDVDVEDQESSPIRRSAGPRAAKPSMSPQHLSGTRDRQGRALGGVLHTMAFSSHEPSPHTTPIRLSSAAAAATEAQPASDYDSDDNCDYTTADEGDNSSPPSILELQSLTDAQRDHHEQTPEPPPPPSEQRGQEAPSSPPSTSHDGLSDTTEEAISRETELLSRFDRRTDIRTPSPVSVLSQSKQAQQTRKRLRQRQRTVARQLKMEGGAFDTDASAYIRAAN